MNFFQRLFSFFSRAKAHVSDLTDQAKAAVAQAKAAQAPTPAPLAPPPAQVAPAPQPPAPAAPAPVAAMPNLGGIGVPAKPKVQFIPAPGTPPGAAFVPRWDLPCAPGTEDTVTLPITGHTLSLPQAAEGIFGYMERVHRQAGDVNDAVIPGGTGAICILGFSPTAQQLGLNPADGSFANVLKMWPVVVDALLNKEAYFPTDPVKAKQTADAWELVFERMKAQNTSPPAPAPMTSNTVTTDVPIE